jgi:hypothetical protein
MHDDIYAQYDLNAAPESDGIDIRNSSIISLDVKLYSKDLDNLGSIVIKGGGNYKKRLEPKDLSSPVSVNYEYTSRAHKTDLKLIEASRERCEETRLSRSIITGLFASIDEFFVGGFFGTVQTVLEGLSAIENSNERVEFVAAFYQDVAIDEAISGLSPGEKALAVGVIEAMKFYQGEDPCLLQQDINEKYAVYLYENSTKGSLVVPAIYSERHAHPTTLGLVFGPLGMNNINSNSGESSKTPVLLTAKIGGGYSSEDGGRTGGTPVMGAFGLEASYGQYRSAVVSDKVYNVRAFSTKLYLDMYVGKKVGWVLGLGVGPSFVSAQESGETKYVNQGVTIGIRTQTGIYTPKFDLMLFGDLGAFEDRNQIKPDRIQEDWKYGIVGIRAVVPISKSIRYFLKR